MANSDESIKVEVVYALPDQQSLFELCVASGTTVKQAIEKSGLLDKHVEIDLALNKVGIFSKVCSLDRVLQAGDRVEVYRPLLLDPKEKRRKRAEKSLKAKPS